MKRQQMMDKIINLRDDVIVTLTIKQLIKNHNRLILEIG